LGAPRHVLDQYSIDTQCVDDYRNLHENNGIHLENVTYFD